MTSKDQFISDKTLSGWWGAIASDSRFDRVLLHASGVAFEGVASSEQREGILKFKEILLTMSIPDAAPVKFTNPGLVHDLEHIRRTAKQPESKQSETKKK